jgi:tRNA-specific 2-thiouridylase
MVGISGGVDSAVAALRLIQAGYRVEGLFMKNWEEDDTTGYCAAEQDLRDAQAVCDRLGIILHKVNFSHDYWEHVFQTFLTEYRYGRTPNPDTMCNKHIKFKVFLEHALELGANRIATGHYARITHMENGYALCKGVDKNKDQSYFLYALGQKELAYTLFPLGEMIKADVRALARQAGFSNYAKKDSTGICFIGERRFREFLARFLPTQPGNIISVDGQLMGRHSGTVYYTLGQRQGLGIGGRTTSSGQPWYVAGKDINKNQLVVVQGHDHPLLYGQGLVADEIHWISGHEPHTPYRCEVQIRYRQTAQACIITKIKDGSWRVDFSNKQRAITPGQAVVFYAGDHCLGGGVITQSIN